MLPTIGRFDHARVEIRTEIRDAVEDSTPELDVARPAPLASHFLESRHAQTKEACGFRGSYTSDDVIAGFRCRLHAMLRNITVVVPDTITVIHCLQAPCYGSFTPMARTDPQVNLRLPAQLKSLLEAAASQSKRSVNSEIVRRLEDSFDPSLTSQLLQSRQREMELLARRAIALVTENLSQQFAVQVRPEHEDRHAASARDLAFIDRQLSRVRRDIDELFGELSDANKAGDDPSSPST